MTISENATRLIDDHTALIEAIKAAEGLHPELHIDGEANPSEAQVCQALKYISLCEEETERPIVSYAAKYRAENLEPQQYVSEAAMIVAAIISGVRVKQGPTQTTLAIRKSIQCCTDFWKWVADHEMTDNPQGRFLQDTLSLIRGGPGALREGAQPRRHPRRSQGIPHAQGHVEPGDRVHPASRSLPVRQNPP